MKNPNGYGSIDKMKGNRRKPWRVRLPKKTLCSDGEYRLKQIPLGYYATRKEAMIALSEYNANPYDITDDSTFKDVYSIVKEKKYSEKGESMQVSMSAAFRHCSALHNMLISDITTDNLQSIFDETEHMSKSTQNNIKIVMSDIYDHCLAKGQKVTNLTQFANLKGQKSKKKKRPFTTGEMEVLADNLDTFIPQITRNPKMTGPYVDTIFILSYSGMRISEMLNLKTSDIIEIDSRLYVDLRGTKTEAAKG